MFADDTKIEPWKNEMKKYLCGTNLDTHQKLHANSYGDGSSSDECLN